MPLNINEMDMFMNSREKGIIKVKPENPKDLQTGILREWRHVTLVYVFLVTVSDKDTVSS